MKSPAFVSDPDFCQEQFDRLLEWLDSDRDKAGEKYERIRGSLIRIFGFRGASNPQELADRTIDRVARKLPGIQTSYSGDPALYFSGVASKIFLEFQREKNAVFLPFPPPPDPGERIEREHARLEVCLSKLSTRDRDLVLAYYSQGERKNADHRKKLADQWGLKLNALCVRVTRIRSGLEACVSHLNRPVAAPGGEA